VDSPLTGFNAKLERADEHLEALDAEIADFLDGNPHSVIYEVDPQTGQKVARFKVHRDLPARRWGLMFGDCVHNMRSGLDHLAWALSRPEPPDRTEFPIFHEREKFESTSPRGGLYKIRGIKDPKARAIIEAVQPCYSDRPTKTSHHLWSLQELSNIDKHQVLHLGVAALSSVGFYGDGGEEFIDSLNLGTLDDGAEIGRFQPRAGESKSQVDMDLSIAFQIALSEGGPNPGMGVPGALRRIREFIRADIARPMVALYGDEADGGHGASTEKG
jgi:hypothetical protein